MIRNTIYSRYDLDLYSAIFILGLADYQMDLQDINAIVK